MCSRRRHTLPVRSRLALAARRPSMPKKPPKQEVAAEEPKSWVCRDPDCAYENEAMEELECEACGEVRYAEEADRERLRVEPTLRQAADGLWPTLCAEYAGFKCGVVVSVEDLADKLKVR